MSKIYKYLLCKHIKKSNCDALRDLVPSVQYKKREKTYEGVLLLALIHGYFLHL